MVRKKTKNSKKTLRKYMFILSPLQYNIVWNSTATLKPKNMDFIAVGKSNPENSQMNSGNRSNRYTHNRSINLINRLYGRFREKLKYVSSNR
jgi:hypothetical protein